MELYAAEIVNGTVSRVIVGTSAWAIKNLGGTWVETTSLPGCGWSWNETEGFIPPVVEVPPSDV